MAATTTLSPYKRFQAILLPNPEIDRAAYDRMQNAQTATDPESVRLRELSNSYKKVLEGGNYNEIRTFVLNAAAELSNSPTYEQFHIRPDDVQADFAKETGLSTQQNQPPSTPEQQPQPGVLAKLAQGFADQKSPSPAGKPVKTDDLVTSLQEQELMKEFDDAIARGDESRINDLMSQSLDLGGEKGLLHRQFEIAAQHINSLTPDQWKRYGVSREQLLNNLQQAAQKKQDEWENRQKKPESAKTPSEKAADKRAQDREADLEKQKTAAFASGDANKKKQAYQALVQHRLRQARAYSVFVDMDEGEDYNFFSDLREALAASYLNRERQRAQAEQEERQIRLQQAQQQQQQASQNGGGGLFRAVRGATKQQAKSYIKQGLKKFLTDKIKKEAIQALWKVLFMTPPYIGWWIVGILAALVVLILIVLTIVIIIVTIFGNNTQGPPAQLGPTCNPSNTCVAALRSIGITVSGDLAFYKDPYGKAKIAYDTLSFISQSPSKYLQLLHTDKNPIYLRFAGGGCAGHASTNGDVTLYGFGSCGTDVAKFMLIHELGHEIAFRNPNLYNRFYNEFPLPVLIFYKLPTYNCELDYGPHGPFPGECFADTLGEYVMYKTYRNTVGGLPRYFEHSFTSFPTAFAPFYKFARDNVFNGLQF